MKRPDSYFQKSQKIKNTEYVSYLIKKLMDSEYEYLYSDINEYTYYDYANFLQLCLVTLTSITENHKNYQSKTTSEFRNFIKALRNEWSHNIPALPLHYTSHSFVTEIQKSVTVRGFAYRSEYIHSILNNHKKNKTSQFLKDKSQKNLTAEQCLLKANNLVDNIKEKSLSIMVKDRYFLTPCLLYMYLTIIDDIYKQKSYTLTKDEIEYDEYLNEHSAPITLTTKLTLINLTIERSKTHLDNHYPDYHIQTF